MAHMTVRMNDDQKSRIQAAADAEGIKPSTWAARELRRAVRRQQIQAYQGPDADTAAWMDAVDAETTAMWQDTAAEADR